jgi:hypothetical protein
VDVNGRVIVRGVQTNLGTLVVTGATQLATSGGLAQFGKNTSGQPTLSIQSSATLRGALNWYSPTNSSRYFYGEIVDSTTISPFGDAGTNYTRWTWDDDTGKSSGVVFNVRSGGSSPHNKLAILDSSRSGIPLCIDFVAKAVGIGTPSPAAALHVAGNVICTTNFSRYIDSTNWVGSWSDASFTFYNGACSNNNLRVTTNNPWTP